MGAESGWVQEASCGSERQVPLLKGFRLAVLFLNWRWRLFAIRPAAAFTAAFARIETEWSL